MEDIIIVVGITLVLVGFAMKFGKKDEGSYSKAKVVEEKSTSSAKDNFDENKVKGDAFEKYVVLKFDTGYFIIKEWRSDKMVNGMYAVSNHFPDLEIEFNFRKKNIQDTFAVECKYRSDYYKNSVEWAQDYQLGNYKKYAAAIKVPVFIVIGVGGKPEDPAELFIVPLQEVKKTILTKDFLSSFKIEDKNNHFYWDVERKILR